MNASIKTHMRIPPLSDLRDLSDVELIAYITAGFEHVFEVLVRRYNQRLFRLARSLCNNDSDAMDILQDGYIIAYSKLGQFTGPTGFGAWLSRIIRNEALMKIRKNQRSPITFINEHNVPDQFSEGPSTDLAQSQLTKLIEQAIDQLPEGYAHVFVLRGVQQLSTQETAASLDLDIAVVKTRYSRAKKLMRNFLEQHIQIAGERVFEFAGYRCDAIVKHVMNRITSSCEGPYKV